ncbi:cation diffusion facilitator family transporter [Candidatus Micrarchaeota archaeon]|nr:cation diffusion facilitator family transporter [Candidatus Micrarchaeota archaeon]
MGKEQRTALLALVSNIVLFLLKVAAALASGSLAVLSSALDSLNDIISYFAGYFSIREASRGPDYDHPFGHRRMEALSAIVMAIFAGILSLEILRSVALSIIQGEHAVEITAFTFAVLAVTVIVKLATMIYLQGISKKEMSTALDAMVMDSRNDVLSNTVAIVGIAGTYMGMLFFDDAAAVIISFYIAYSGYQVAKRNFDYIVGAKPEKKIMDGIARKARTVEGVKSLGAIRAHYVGDRVHVEIEVVLPKKTKGPESHDIAVRVQGAIESMKVVSRAFVHIDYE